MTIEFPDQAQVVTMSFFQFNGFENRRWAMKHMQYAKRPLDSIPGVLFRKILGTGGKGGYSLIPDLGTYALLVVWNSYQEALNGLEQNIYREYERISTSHIHFFLSPISAKGSWSGFSDFRPHPIIDGIPHIAAITRAKIRFRYLPVFWSFAPKISREHQNASGKLFSKGVGEYPLFEQATFTIWESLEHMNNFARKHTHQDAIKSSYRENGFSEYLFARFQPIGYRGKPADKINLPEI